VIPSALIWNRACSEDRLRSLPGDRALTDMLQAHNLTMNGGVMHAVGCLTADELSAAKAGYRFYGFDGVVPLLAHARAVFETDDEEEDFESILDAQYADLIPCDNTLVERFEDHLKSNPSDFAPVRAIEMEKY
jgi:hypothetical protein